MTHYINGERFTALAREEEPDEELVLMFYLLSERVWQTHAVRRFVDREDAKQEAAMRCLQVLVGFRARVRGTAYSYFRSVIYNLFCDIVKAERRRRPERSSPADELTDLSCDFRPYARKKYRHQP